MDPSWHQFMKTQINPGKELHVWPKPGRLPVCGRKARSLTGTFYRSSEAESLRINVKGRIRQL